MSARPLVHSRNRPKVKLKEKMRSICRGFGLELTSEVSIRLGWRDSGMRELVSNLGEWERRRSDCRSPALDSLHVSNTSGFTGTLIVRSEPTRVEVSQRGDIRHSRPQFGGYLHALEVITRLRVRRSESVATPPNDIIHGRPKSTQERHAPPLSILHELPKTESCFNHPNDLTRI